MGPGGNASIRAGPGGSNSGRPGRSAGRAKRDAAVRPFRATSHERAAAGGRGAARRRAVARGPRPLRGACVVAAAIGHQGLGRGADGGGRECRPAGSVWQNEANRCYGLFRKPLRSAAVDVLSAEDHPTLGGGLWTTRHYPKRFSRRNTAVASGQWLGLQGGAASASRLRLPRADLAAPAAAEVVTQHGRRSSAESGNTNLGVRGSKSLRARHFPLECQEVQSTGNLAGLIAAFHSLAPRIWSPPRSCGSGPRLHSFALR